MKCRIGIRDGQDVGRPTLRKPAVYTPVSAPAASLMRNVALRAIALAVLLASALSAQSRYNQPWRPQYQFTPVQNFMNDPNGLVFYKGEYHLFYQYNPEGNRWGHMSWGHAVSPDLIHWQPLPLAIPEQPAYMIYTGSAVVDWKNSSGLCHSGEPRDPSCLVAIYTASTEDRWQRQNIAVSDDRGRSWTQYSGNPVADLKAKDFRDPHVFWYEPQKKWVMIAVLADERTAVLLESHDLKNWKEMSRFGPAGDREGQWECPDLFELPLDGTHEKRWVLIVNRNPGAPAGGTGVRYMVGNFDGTRFVAETPDETKLWADYGKDFYATQSYNDIPASDGRRIWIGWISNWQYANAEPTELWRGAQSFPRELRLKRFSEGIRLVQKPVREMQRLRHETMNLKNLTVEAAEARIGKAKFGELLEIEAEILPGNATEIGFRVRKTRTRTGAADRAHTRDSAKDVETVVGFSPVAGTVFIDRSRSGDTAFSKDFPGRHTAVLQHRAGVKLHIFVDRSSLEVFANDGEVTMSDRIYPPPGSDGLELYSVGQGARVLSLTVWSLDSIWTQASKYIGRN